MEQGAPLAGLEQRKRWTIMGAVMLGLFLSAMDQTIVGTALPRIIAELSGLELYAWVFTSYMLASTTVIPIVGKMGDIFGRKRFFIAGIAVFLVGSVLCGMSQSMVQLIIFRGLQGVGGGMMFANAFAIVGDLYPPAERGKYAGLMSGVFGIASVLGPLIGGYITDNLDWRWVFYVNLPLGGLALFVLWVVLPGQDARREDRSVDYLGAAALAATIAPLLLAFSWAGSEYAWTSPQVLTTFAIAAFMAGVFVLAERRAKEPVIPFQLFRNDIFAVSTAVTFVTGAGMFAGSVYIPLFMQGVLGFSATNSGLVMMPMTVAMVCGSMISGQLVSRTGHYRWISPIGLAVATSGMFLLSTMNENSSQQLGMAGMATLGFGLGLSFPPLMLAAQNAVPFSLMGSTTSLNTFARSVGGTIGVAIMGSVLTRRLNEELAAGLPQRVQDEAPDQLLDGLRNPQVLLDDGVLEQMRQGFDLLFGADGPALFTATISSMQAALATTITEVFFIGACLMSVGFVLTFFVREIPLRTTNAPVAAALGEGAIESAPVERPALTSAPAPSVASAASPATLRPAPEPADSQRSAS